MKKMFAFMLILASMLTACSPSGRDQAQDPSASASAVNETAEQEITELSPGLPDSDFDGFEYIILTETEYNGKYKLAPETEEGEPLNDAAYIRNGIVGDTYNVVIGVSEQKDLYSALQNAVLSGDKSFSLVIPHPQTQTSKMMSSHLLYDINSLPYIDMNKPWWNPSIAEEFSIGGRLYYSTGDLSITYQGFVALMFNKSFIGTFGLEEPYVLVNDGKWDIDRFTNMLKTVSSDIDGDGKFTSSDRYGYTGIEGCGYIFSFACGQSMSVHDENDIPRLALNSERMADLVEKYYQLLYADNMTWLGGEQEIVDMFKEERALFTAIDIGCWYGRTRDIDLDFGLLPYPKYDESQKAYYSGFGGGIFAVPLLCDDPDRSGILLEALNYESYKLLRPAYFEIVLYNKCLRDDQSVEILTMRHNSKKCDFAFNFSSSGIGNILTSLVEQKKSSDYASYYASVSEKLTVEFDNLITGILSAG